MTHPLRPSQPLYWSQGPSPTLTDKMRCPAATLASLPGKMRARFSLTTVLHWKNAASAISAS